MARKKEGEKPVRAPYPAKVAFKMGKYLLRKIGGIHLQSDISAKSTCFLNIFYEQHYQEEGLIVPDDFKYLRILDDEAGDRFYTVFQKLFNPIYPAINDFVSYLGDKSCEEIFKEMGLIKSKRDLSDLVHVLVNCGWENLLSGIEQGQPFSEVILNECTTLGKPGLVGLQDFWQVLVEPRPGTSLLESYVLQQLQIDSARQSREGIGVYHSGISVNPNTLLSEGRVPRAFVPEKNWFPERFQKLTSKDFLLLFPEAEQRLLSLTIGRALAGRDGSITAEGRLLAHGWRTLSIIYGKEPGQGKSRLCSYIIEAMQSIGYTVTNFKTLNRRFGLARVIQSDLAYKDDFTSESLKSSLTGEDTKTIISGGMAETEEKNVPSVEVPANSAFLANCNKVDPNSRFSYDPGINDRTSFLTTLSNLELDKLAESMGVESLRPYIYLPKIMTEKYDCSLNMLMLYFLRLCLDEFMYHHDEGSLEDIVRSNKIKLRTLLEGEHLYSLALCQALANCLASGNREVKQLSGLLLINGLKNFAKLAYLPETEPLRSPKKPR